MNAEEIAPFKLKDVCVAMIRTIFTLLDTDMDGLLGDDQVRTAITALGVRHSVRLIREIKMSAPSWVGQKVDIDTFVQVMEKHIRKNPIGMDDVKELFQVFDEDKSGFVKPNDLKHLLSGVTTTDNTQMGDQEVTELFDRLGIKEEQDIDYVQFTKKIASGFASFV
eukprot:TRINITY_DN780047_c0_g1_i1.p1 TRINITY_DN780047_c0_g1~~TRINITY_DN780047_c0_g1_i1.p1  ORF type:complete len:166 (-),score=41.64 TRINITY_DN780047_c0_g1_i1:154-651(-)